MAATQTIAFTPDHLIALGGCVAAATLVVRFVRKQPEASDRVRTILSYLLPVLFLIWPIEQIFVQHKHPVWAVLPLELCTFNLIMVCATLFTLRQGMFECAYFWTFAAFIAMVTPPLGEGFPAPRFLVFFALHGLLLIAWAFLVWGVRMRPTKNAWLRVWGWTNVFAAVVAVVDVAFNQNFFFLMRKPRVQGTNEEASTLLDWFGPWPVYIIAVDLVFGLLFYLMQVIADRATTARVAATATAGPQPQTVPVSER